MTEPGVPEDRLLRPPMTARRETPPTWTVGRLVSRAAPSMPPRARARHFSSRGAAILGVPPLVGDVGQLLVVVHDQQVEVRKVSERAV